MRRKKHKNKSNTPRHKRMKRQGRLQSAQAWLPTYNGKNVVHGYAKHFAVNKVCAALELKMIGVMVDEAYVEQLKATELALVKQRQIARQKKIAAKTVIDPWPDTDETFAYIAGYTSWGFAYGTTWEELGAEIPPACEGDCDDSPEYRKSVQTIRRQTGDDAIEDDLPF
jgi:hypothetical protein